MRASFLTLAALAAVGLIVIVTLAAGEDPPPPPPPPVKLVQIRQPIRVGVGAKPAVSVDQATQDKKALEAVGIRGDDYDGMLKYIESRTLTDVDLKKITGLIKKLGDDDFDTRTAASAQLEKIGPPAIAPLQTAAQDGNINPESQYRSKEALKRMEKVPHAEIAAACARALAKGKKPAAVPVLLAYLPLADNGSVSDAIRDTLAAYAVVDGKPSPVLLDALADTNPIRRGAVGVALLGNGENPDVLKAVLPKVLAAAKAETDPNAKFAMTFAVLLVGRDKAAMPLVLDLLPGMTRSQVWQVEDVLVQLAGTDAPKARCIQGNKESFAKAQKAWTEWWDKAGDKLDLAKAELSSRIQGRLFVLGHDYRFGAQGLMIEFGGDEKEKNRIAGMAMPMDVAFTGNGRMWLAEQNTSSIVERDENGKQLTTRQILIDLPGGGRMGGQPQGVQAMPDGGVMAVCRNALVVYDKKGDIKVKYVRPNNANFGNHDMSSAVRLTSGEFALFVLNQGPQGQKPQVIFLDKEGKEIDKKVVAVPTGYHQGAIIESGDGRVMVTENNKVTEYDVKTGKSVWEKTGVNQPRSLQRLPNGNTLILHNHPGTLIEVTPEGETAWTFDLRETQLSLIMRAVLK
jgi:hypothetical protein